MAITKQKAEVEKQNEILKNYLQQYYDGFHVNNVVMTNENPLLVVNKINPILIIMSSMKEKTQNNLCKKEIKS